MAKRSRASRSKSSGGVTGRKPGESRAKCMSRNLKGHKPNGARFGRVSKACSRK